MKIKGAEALLGLTFFARMSVVYIHVFLMEIVALSGFFWPDEKAIYMPD